MIGVLVVLILPVPRLLLDLLLAVSITFSVLVLLTSLFIEKPLQFSAFPAVLLIATMLRLALNLASTRLILAEGHQGSWAAGRVIEAFGGFIMQGNFVIGLIVFAILVIVNFGGDPNGAWPGTAAARRAVASTRRRPGHVLCQARRFDLLLRTEQSLPPRVQREVRELYLAARDVAGLVGEVRFPRRPVARPARASRRRRAGRRDHGLSDAGSSSIR